MDITDEIKQKRTEMMRNEVGDVNPIIQELFAYMDKTFKKRFIPKLKKIKSDNDIEKPIKNYIIKSLTENETCNLFFPSRDIPELSLHTRIGYIPRKGNDSKDTLDFNIDKAVTDKIRGEYEVNTFKFDYFGQEIVKALENQSQCELIESQTWGMYIPDNIDCYSFMFKVNIPNLPMGSTIIGELNRIPDGLRSITFDWILVPRYDLLLDYLIDNNLVVTNSKNMLAQPYSYEIAISLKK